SRRGCEMIIRYAFEYARARGRKKVTSLTKDNIMKLTDGLFHQVFDEIALEYPDLTADHMIVDIGMARMAATPERFDVVVTPNLYGDILSDVAAEVSGSVGLAGSANIGDHGAMFEAVHGSAPDIAGQNIANPSGLLLSAVKMLAHIGQGNVAEKVHNAWLRTIEDGIHTHDIYSEAQSKKRAGTREFAQAVAERLGESPRRLNPVHYRTEALRLPVYRRKEPARRTLVGVDVFLYWRGERPEELAAQLQKANTSELHLAMITNRGVKVWPEGFPETFCTDHWRCRFLPESMETINQGHIIRLLENIAQTGLEFIKTETLCAFDGRLGFSLGQGQ
ncbi:MAG TPA: isocitrate/isopropylmalate family dehydrogenase, partial [Blastocatellia bacterium]